MRHVLFYFDCQIFCKQNQIRAAFRSLFVTFFFLLQTSIISLLVSDLDSYHLKERLVENEDFVLVPAEAWHKLLAWYGIVDGQPPLERKVPAAGATYTPSVEFVPWAAGDFCLCVCFPMYQVVDLPSTLKVEVYPVEIFLCLHSNMENVITAQFSRADTIREFVSVLIAVTSLNSLCSYLI